MKAKSFYRRNRNIIAKRIGDEYIVINPDKEKFYTLNETGEIIIRFFCKKRSFADAVERLHQEFSVSKNRLRKDIYTFIEKLLKENIIVKL